MYESEIRRFARLFVVIAKIVVNNPDEPAAPIGGGGFAEWVMIAVNGLRIKLGKSYRETYDLLSEMPGVLAELGLKRPPSYVTIYNWFKRVPTPRWRAVLRASATLSGHAAIDSTGFDRDRPSRYYAQRAPAPAATTPNGRTTATAPCR